MEKIETIVENGVEYRRVELTERGLWLLYRAMVCDAIEKANETETVGSDLWMFTDALGYYFINHGRSFLLLNRAKATPLEPIALSPCAFHHLLRGGALPFTVTPTYVANRH